MKKSNLDRYKEDLEELLTKGNQLLSSLKYKCYRKEFESSAKRELGAKAEQFLKDPPRFESAYQDWYSEAKVLINQLLPDRLADFVRHYEKPKPRKDISFENYRIEDCLQGLVVTRGWDSTKVVGQEAAIPHVEQQLAILRAVKRRFESSLFEIRQLVVADLFDSETDAARELAKKKFFRAAGTVAGVVLEKHLTQVCRDHSVRIRKARPSIGDLNNLLKAAGVVDVPQWRFIQHLADVRNYCGHSRDAEPTAEQVEDLIAGVAKTLKTVL